MERQKKKVVVAMSGGVDSSVAALLLKKKGFKVIGVFMHFWSESGRDDSLENKCCSLEAQMDARRVAQKLGLPLYTFNFKTPFKKIVVNNFIDEYRQGQTPNPCILCNKFIKVDLLLKKAKALGANYLATGHYLKKWQTKDGTWKIGIARDKNKDQSYFLYNLTQKELPYFLFPIGDYLKSEVRKLAQKAKLPVFSKKESQGICFISGKNPDRFLRKHLRGHFKEGPIKDQNGKPIGCHHGLPFYTIGQREKIGIGGFGPYYVVKTNRRNNTLEVTNNPKDLKLFGTSLKVADLSWVNGQPPKLPFKVQAKIRYGQPGVAATVFKKGSRWQVKFLKPQRAITSGQSVVFYLPSEASAKEGKGQELIGGGVIRGKLKVKN